MRKLTGAVFISLDGVIQAPGGPEEDPTSGFDHGGWVQPLWGEDMGPFEGAIMAWKARFARSPPPVVSSSSRRGVICQE